MAAKKSEFVRPLTVRIKRLGPQHLRIGVRTIVITQGTTRASGATLMNDHRVMPRGEPRCQGQCFSSANNVGK